MAVDIPTILVMLALVCGTVGVIFVSAWIGNRGGEIELRLACTMLPVAVGIALVLMQRILPQRVWIDLANTLIALGLGYGWSVARVFNGRVARTGVVVAGAVIWLAACQVPVFYETTGYRVALISLIGAGYTAGAGVEFLRAGPDGVLARRLVAILCCLQAGVSVGRAAYWFFGLASDDPFKGNLVQGLFLIEPMVAVITFAILGMALARGRREHVLRSAAETDALTGVLNRRALQSQGALALNQAHKAGDPVAMLVFDLDHFKSINDRFGHPVGDETLRAFTRIATQAIRSSDLFGRIGGEEFAAMLVGADGATGERIAERIRQEFAAANHVDGIRTLATVSVGVAEATADGDSSFDTLMGRADAALYEAKRSGRDRVVSALPLAS